MSIQPARGTIKFEKMLTIASLKNALTPNPFDDGGTGEGDFMEYLAEMVLRHKGIRNTNLPMIVNF
jgi:hypothetical protein